VQPEGIPPGGSEAFRAQIGAVMLGFTTAFWSGR